MLADHIDEIAKAADTGLVMAEEGILDRASAVAAFRLIRSRLDLIEGTILDAAGVAALPVLTLSDVASLAPRSARPGLTVIDGGRT